MKNKFLFISLLLFAIANPTIAQDETDINSFFIGKKDLSVYRECYYPCKPENVIFINVHDNEKTSVNAATNYLKSNGGTLIYIYNQGERNISFDLGKSKFTFDPNRIFNKKGRIATITTNSPTFDKKAEKHVARFADPFLRKFVKGKDLIVAFHNNTDSNFSILSYMHSIDSLPVSGKYFINPEMDPDDFIITNSIDIFDSVKSRNINVVWENAQYFPDDGSLSIFSGKNNIPYINIEAEHQHLEPQQRMLSTIDDIIKKYKSGDKNLRPLKDQHLSESVLKIKTLQ